MKTLRIAFAVSSLLLAVTPAFAAFADDDMGQSEKERAVEREEEMYEDGLASLDDQEWKEAANTFRKVARMTMSHADAALYWLAYSQEKLGQRSEALTTLQELQNTYPKSRWQKDGKALEAEIRQSAGQKIDSEQISDEDVKLMILNGLMSSDPERAVPVLEKLVNSPNQSKKVKERALFVLSQSSAPRAMEILGRIAKDGSNPELQSKALRYLGISGGETSRKILAEVYASSGDASVKKAVLKSYMVAGDRARLLMLAKSEPNPELRADAVTQLGVLGARNELADLYATESSVDIRKKIIKAMFIGGNADKLADIARSEKVKELRLAAIQNLGLLGGSRSSQALVSIYESDQDLDVRKKVIKALFLQQGGKELVALARKEKNPVLRKEIISKLSLIQSQEAVDYLMEFLKE